MAAYPERPIARRALIERMISQAGWRLHRLFHRRLRADHAFESVVARYAAASPDESLPERALALRYRLRRDGITPSLLAECFGLYGTALARCGAAKLSAEAVVAARSLVSGIIVGHPNDNARLDALALAAAVFALQGTPVHLFAASEPRARRLEARLAPPFAALGLKVGLVTPGMPPAAQAEGWRCPLTCATHRDAALAYLQDHLKMGGQPRLFHGRPIFAAARKGAMKAPLLPGLHCALIDDADLVMLDDALMPVTISVETEAPERLLYEQALELARAFTRGADFTQDASGVALTESGAARLAQLVAPLGGAWAAAHSREELVCTALFALYGCERGRDYQVAADGIVFPPPQQDAGEDGAGPDMALRTLVALKEGRKPDGVRNVLARSSVPRFLRRYLHLAGVCADARGLESEFWELYGLKTLRAGSHAAPAPSKPRMFSTVEKKRNAVIAAVQAAAARSGVIVAVRTPRELQALAAALRGAGITPGLMRGGADAADHEALAAVDRVGGVALALFPAGYNLARASGAPPVHLIVTELHDARRHMERLTQSFRASSSQLLLALDEEAIAKLRGSEPDPGFVEADADTGELPAQRAREIARNAQRQAEELRAGMRKDLTMRDDYMGDLLAFSGQRE